MKEFKKRNSDIIKDRLKGKMTFQSIANKYKISKQRVCQIVANYLRKKEK